MAAGGARLRARVHPAARHGADAVEPHLFTRTGRSDDSPHEHGPAHVPPGSVLRLRRPDEILPVFRAQVGRRDSLAVRRQPAVGAPPLRRIARRDMC